MSSYSSPLPEFPRNLVVAQAAGWFTPTDLQQLLRTLSGVYFPIVEQRAMGFSVLNQPVPAVPFQLSPAFRFSAVGAYASDLDPVLSRLFSQLRAALSFKDRAAATSSRAVTDRAVTNLTVEYVSAFNAFQSALADFAVYASTTENYTDRQTFEAAYSLTWS